MSSNAPAAARARLAATWATLAARERRLVVLAASVVVLALLWWLALAPALGVLRSAPAQRQALQQEAQHMQRLQQQAEALKALPKLGRDEAVQALQAATTQRLGRGAQIAMVGDRAQVTLKDVPAQALADWLQQARANARAVPMDARLTRSGDRTPGAPVLWSGTLSLGLPG